MSFRMKFFPSIPLAGPLNPISQKAATMSDHVLSSSSSQCNLGMLLLDGITSTTYTKAQKQWRVAYIAIHFTLSLARDSSSVPCKTSQHTRAFKRWRLAYTVISISQSMLSHVRQKLVPYPPPAAAAAPPPAAATPPPPICTIVEIEETVQPPPILEIEDDVDGACSSFRNIDQARLAEMVKEKDLNELSRFGGIKGLAKALQTDPEDGTGGDDRDVSLRQRTFGSNTYHKPPPKGLGFFVVEAFKDTIILILLGCAALSLGFGIKEHGAGEGWYEGGSIIVAVYLVVGVSALSNFRQERQFDKLSKISSNIQIEVARDGRRQKISIFDIVVGDIVFLAIGDQIPADGLFLKGHSLQVDESSMTGESDHVEVDSVQNPFLLSGSKVVDGYAQMLVTSVGMNTAWGKMMSSITQDSNEQTPLQARLDKLTSAIGKVGLAVAFLVLVVLLIRYFTGNTDGENGNKEFTSGRTDINDVFNSVVNMVAAAVTIVVVAIPEGLPLAVTLTLAYSMKRMMADQAMVRKLPACETMGSATVIVNVAALVINFIAAVSSGDVPLTAVQLLWVNLIMDTLGALALATERPTDELMHRKPVGRTEPLITNIMWRNLIAQALFQIAILLTLQFRGKSIFNASEAVKNTLIFNTFVLCQVFNEFNSRNLENWNVFTGLHKNQLFIGIVGITIALQIVMVEFLKKFADTERLDWWQWLICTAIAAASWPISWVVKLIPVPEEPFFTYIRGLGSKMTRSAQAHLT